MIVRRARLIVALAVIALGCSCSKSSAHHPGGDPDGHLLAALRPVLAAVPENAVVTTSGSSEPFWTSCDGRAGTWGWGDVVVQANFVSSDDELVVFAYADKVVSKLGWKTERLPVDHGFGDVTWTWTKEIAPVGPVRLTLSHDGAWDLMTTAVPENHATGC